MASGSAHSASSWADYLRLDAGCGVQFGTQLAAGSITCTETIEPEEASYLWNSREAAERFYSEAWRTTIAQRYGVQPEISFYDTAVIVDNVDEKTASAA